MNSAKSLSDDAVLERRAGATKIGVVMTLLFVVSILNYMDRYLVTILIEPIREEFGLSDTQAGLISGLGFALLYAGMALPMATLADRVDRAKLLACVVGLWSIATALCGAAGNFAQLFLARLGVGANEAGCLPTMHSIIADYFPPARRALALSTLSVGATIGASLSYLVGGYVAQHYGWRPAFLLAGLPGVFVAALVFFFLRDSGHAKRKAAGAALPLKAALAQLWRRRSFVGVVVGMSLGSITSNATSAWKPAYYQRVFGMSLSEVGVWMSASQLLTGFFGVLVGGWVADRFHKRDKRSALWVIAFSLAIAPAFGLATFTVSDPKLSLILLQFFMICSGLWPGPYAALQQALAGPRYRATSSAIAMIGAAFLGFTVGPLFVGAISDWLTPTFGALSLRYALALSMLFSLWGLVHVLLATRTLVADMESAEAEI